MKKCLLFVLLACSLLLLASCSKEDIPPETEPTNINIQEVTFSTASVQFTESGHSGFGAFGLNKTMDAAQRNGVTFAFEPTIPMEDRAHCIQTTEAVLNKIGTGRKFQINIYTTETYGASFVKDGAVYTHLQDWKSPEYIATVLYAIFGEYCNYGLAYGYANYLLDAVYRTGLSVLEEEWIFTGSNDCLDLSLLCFRFEYLTGKEVKMARKVSNTFVSEYIHANGEAAFRRLLGSSGSTETVGNFVDALTDFYASKKIDYTPSPLLYRLGGKTYNYMVKCPYATMYVENDWTDRNLDLCPYTYEGFLHKNYADTKRFFTVNAEHMASYQKHFGFDSYDNDLTVYLSNTNGNSTRYDGTIHAVTLQNTGSFMWAYVHAVTYGRKMLEPWAYSGFAYYFDRYYNDYGNAMSTVDYNSASIKCFQEYRAKIGRDIDMSIDFAEVMHVTTYAYGYDDPNDGYGRVAGASFIDYLISRFGEEKVIEIICETHDFGGYTYDQLVADWQAFIQENYSCYTKVK